MRVILLVLGLTSCLLAAPPKIPAWEAVGRFYSLGFESQRSLELREDWTFLTVLCVRGSDLAEKKIEERGTWTIEGDVIALTPEDGKPYGPDVWYSRLLLRKHGATRQLRVGVPGAWGFDEMGLEEEGANQRPEANAGKESVSPTTPGPGVAHP